MSIKHGMSRTRLYGCWVGMKERCDNKNRRFYHRYGGRGITYCKEWENFEPFMDWALANGYSDGLTLDRINNDGNYEPSNCRWATQSQQSYNKTHLPNATGFKGVHPSRRHKGGEIIGYKATAFLNHREVYIGFSKSPEKAAEIRRKYLLENHYDFAL